MSNEQSQKINLGGMADRLTSWRQNLQDNIDSSARKAIESHVDSVSGHTFSDAQKLEDAMNKVRETALQKVEEMQKYEMDSDKIRQAILPSIFNMASPYPENSELNAKFSEQQKQVYDSVDSKIVGANTVLFRNMRT